MQVPFRICIYNEGEPAPHFTPATDGLVFTISNAFTRAREIPFFSLASAQDLANAGIPPLPLNAKSTWFDFGNFDRAVSNGWDRLEIDLPADPVKGTSSVLAISGFVTDKAHGMTSVVLRILY